MSITCGRYLVYCLNSEEEITLTPFMCDTIQPGLVTDLSHAKNDKRERDSGQ